MFLQSSFTLDSIILKQSFGKGRKLKDGEYKVVNGPQSDTLKHITRIKIGTEI